MALLRIARTKCLTDTPGKKTVLGAREVTLQSRGDELLLRTEWVLRAAVLAAFSTLLLVFLASAAAAQGCAMCYQSAAASSATGRAALRHGILVLLLPAVGLFLGIFGLLYCRRHPTR